MYRTNNELYGGPVLGGQYGVYSSAVRQRPKPRSAPKKKTEQPKEEESQKSKDLEEKLDLLDDEVDELLNEVLDDKFAHQYKLKTDGQ